LKTQSYKQKELKNRAQKRDKTKEDKKEDSNKKLEQLPNIAEEANAVERSKNIEKSSDGVVSGSNLALMEARKRKFESTGPVKPDGKRIRLKEPHPQPQEKDLTQQAVHRHTSEEKDKQAVTALATLDDSALLEGEDLDEPYLELQSADTWSTDENDSDSEARFKSSMQIQTAGSGKVMFLSYLNVSAAEILQRQIGLIIMNVECIRMKLECSVYHSVMLTCGIGMRVIILQA
jgi:hypothetical protein